MKRWYKYANGEHRVGAGDFYCKGKTFTEAFLRWINAVGKL